MKALCILGIYFLMWFLVTFVCKYIDSKNLKNLDTDENLENLDADDTVSNELLGLFWPITAPLLVLVGLWFIIKYIGKIMNKFIDKK